ncbi:MAG: HlyD family type I secretion periplasmic adaptor subunit [Selenomonadales bacterium]|nr:HlyD family type I secretion periplasmic adaptor subunit [Selenomonadales bacterium]
MKIKEIWDNFINGTEKEQETEFLPAILEVTETPPSPTGRLVMWSILTLLVVGILWSVLGHINEVAVAPGKVIPTGQVKTIQVKNKSIVKEIHVKEGQHVEKGDTLVVMDPTSTDADYDSLNKRAAYYALDIQRLEAELNGTSFSPKSDPNLELKDITAEQSLYQSRVSQHRAEMEAAANAVNQKQAALNAERVNLNKYDEMLEIAREKERRLIELTKENAISEFQLFEQTSQRINYEKTAAAQLDLINRAEAELSEAQAKLSNLDAAYKKDVMASLVESRKQYYALTEESKKADENQRLSTVVAPCSGTVYNLAVHTEGGVVTDAQPLMVIVPDGVELEFEVWAENKDIGFIKEGQEAEVKVATFNFQKFGMLTAYVDEISADSNSDKSDPEKNKRFRLLLKLDENTLKENPDIHINPGMEVTAEIKIKEKRIIEFFLDPFRRYTHESLRER